MASMEAALIVTAPGDKAANNASKAAQRKLRIRQAEALNIGGVFVGSGDLMLYRAHGEAENIDRFMDVLALDAEGSVQSLIGRWTVPRRAMHGRRLRRARLVGDESNWLMRQLATPSPDARLLRVFAWWVELREKELNMGFDFNLAAAASGDSFPPSRSIKGLDLMPGKPDQSPIA